MLVGVKSQAGDNRGPWVITAEENGRMYVLLADGGQPEVYSDRKEAETRALFISSGKMDPEPQPEPEPEPEPVRKGCFLTTACEVALGEQFRDDGVELETLRAHRDRLAAADDQLRDKVAEYYRAAPLIVSRIDAAPDPRAEYLRIYRDLVLPTNALLAAGRDAEAVATYYAGFSRLAEKYRVRLEA